jgi:NAD(P)-dependent dehydrogenase (short-subunit alcohol dehydrogenase family)
MSFSDRGVESASVVPIHVGVVDPRRARGSGEHVPEHDPDRSTRIHRTVATNLKGTFFTVQTLLPVLRDGASVILTSSIAARKGFPAFSVYSATKAAIRSLARTLTMDLKDRRIRVNALGPEHINTEIGKTAGLSQEENDTYFERTVLDTPLGRNGQADYIAAAALYLASDESAFVTGIDLLVDRGYAQIWPGAA